MNLRASKTLTQALSSNFNVSSSTITVFGFIIANSDSSDVEVTWTNSAGTLLGVATVGSHDSFESRNEWIADAGLIFTSASSASVHVTVFISGISS